MSTSVDISPAPVHAQEWPAAVTETGRWWPAGTTALGVGLALAGMARTSEDGISGLGLVTALDPLYFVGLGLVLVGAVADLLSPSSRRLWFAAHLVALAFVLHGIPGMVEANPRFPTAYLHVGFVDQIAENGSFLQGLDARFSWPGFFAGNALLQEATGGSPVVWALRFFPLAVNLVMLVLVDALGRTTHVSLHRRRAAQLLFLTCNWIGQDYFSPQATASVLYLAAILVAVTAFPGDGLPERWLRRLGARPQRAVPEMTSLRRAGAMAVLMLLTAAMVGGHQLTPGFLALSLLLLAMARLSGLRAFPFAIVVATVGWLSFAATPYWSGHLEKVTGSAGRVSDLVKDNVTSRASSGSFERSVVVQSRLAFSVLLILAVAVSIYLLRRRRRLPVLLGCLVVAPWPMLLLQSYGGEMALRVLLFSLPALSLLAASALLPTRARMQVHHHVALGLVLVALVPLFLVARFGNEQYERVSSDDLAVLRLVYDGPPGTALVLTANSKAPRYYDRVDEVRFASLDSLRPADIVEETTSRGNYDARYVFFGETQDAFGVELQGRRPGWTLTLARRLVRSGTFTPAARQGDSVLLRLVPDPPGSG